MRRRLGVAAAVSTMAVVVAMPAGANALTKTVYAGGPPNKVVRALAVKVLGVKTTMALGKVMPGINAFTNTSITINAGDSVKWTGLAQNFHTVDIPAVGGSDLPLVLPGATVTGVNDFGGSPFWFNGKVPTLGFNPALLAPSGGTTYSGKTRVESGLPLSPKAPNTVKVTFTKPGVYKYFCDIHPGMIGYVVVKAKGKTIPTPAQDAVALNKQLTTDVLAAAKVLKAKQPANQVSLGLSTAGGVELYSMFPAALSVKAGTVVTFSMSTFTREVHTASFGPASYLSGLAKGLFASPGITAESLYPSDNPALGPIQISPTSHGNGFANTGGLDRDPTTPFPVSQKIDFTKSGTYHYICLIHPFMHGTIVVH